MAARPSSPASTVASKPSSPVSQSAKKEATLGIIHYPVVSLQNHKEKYAVTLDNGILEASSTKVIDYERYSFYNNLDGTISIRSLRCGFVTVSNKGVVLACGVRVDEEAKFHLVYHGNKTYSFKSSWGFYLSCKDSKDLHANSPQVGEAEKFVVESVHGRHGQIEVNKEPSDHINPFEVGACVLCKVKDTDEFIRGYVAGLDRNGYLLVNVEVMATQAAGGETHFPALWRGDGHEAKVANSYSDLKGLSHDISMLPAENEDAILDCLKWRWEHELAITCVRQFVVVLSSTKRADGYHGQSRTPAGAKTIQDFVSDADQIKQLRSEAMLAVEVYGRSACFIFQGEAGSSRGVFPRTFLGHLVKGAEAAKDQPQGNRTIKQLFDAAHAMLSSFCSAVTPRGSGARCGTFWQIWPGRVGHIAAKLTISALELSRIGGMQPEERCFDIFYQLLRGLPAHSLQSFGLSSSFKDYNYLGRVPKDFSDDDERGYNAILAAMDTFGVNGHQAEDIFRALAGILACGDVVPAESKLAENPSVALANIRVVLKQRVAPALGLSDWEQLEKELLEAAHIDGSLPSIDEAEACTLRMELDALARCVYEAIVFTFLDVINAAFGRTPPSRKWVGVLDYTGFESFRQLEGDNGVAQLVVNHANELIQQAFCRRIIQEEILDAMAVEGNNDGRFDDNLHVIALVQGVVNLPWVPQPDPVAKEPPSILTLLDASCADVRGNDGAFANTCYNSFRLSSYFSATRAVASRQFTIAHSHRPVDYTASGFREHNRKPRLGPKLLEMLMASDNLFLRDAFGKKRSENSAVSGTRTGVVASRLEVAKKAELGDARQRVSSFIECLLKALPPEGWVRFVKILKASKPVGTLQYRAFDWNGIQEDLHSTGIFTAMKLHRQQKNNCYRHIDFVTSFSEHVLLTSKGDKPNFHLDLKALVEATLKNALSPQSKALVKVEQHFALLPDNCVQELQTKSSACRSDIAGMAILVQRLVRGRITGRLLMESSLKLQQLQARARRRLRIDHELSQRACRRQMLGALRVLTAAQMFNRRMESSDILTVYLRSLRDMVNYRKLLLKRHVHCAIRAREARRILTDFQSGDVALQKFNDIFDTLLARSELLAHLSAMAAQDIERIFRGKKGRVRYKTVASEAEARNALAGAIKTLSMRCVLSRQACTEAAISMQTQRRALLIRRQTRKTFAETSSAQLVIGTFKCFEMRRVFMVRLENRATATLQTFARQKAEEANAKYQVDRKDAVVALNDMIKTAHLRANFMNYKAKESARFIQRCWRGRMGRMLVKRFKSEKYDWELVTRVMQTYLHRQRHTRLVQTNAVILLQCLFRSAMASKRVFFMRVRRLQTNLHKALNRLRARRLLLTVDDENERSTKAQYLAGIFACLIQRSEFVALYEARASQRFQRFMAARHHEKKSRRLKNLFCTVRIISCARRYMAQGLLLRLRWQRSQERARQIWQVHVDRALWRCHFCFIASRTQAVEMLQRVGRGYISRKRTRLLWFEKEAIQAVKVIHKVWHKFVAVKALNRASIEDSLYQASIMVANVFLTLQWRASAEIEVRDRKQAKAQAKIAALFRGNRVRAQPHLKEGLEIVNHIRKEHEDRRYVRRNEACLMLQKSWKSRRYKIQELLPRIIQRLGAERKHQLRAREKESRELQGLSSKATFAGAGSHVADITILSSSIAEAPGWAVAFSKVEKEGGTILDIVLSAEHGFVVCATGNAYFISIDQNEDGIRSIGEPIEITFHDKFPGSCYSLAFTPIPKITRAACGLGHVLFMSSEGLVYTWGLNVHGQCGIVLEHHKHLEIVPELMCVQTWALPVSNMREPELGHRGNEGLPRVRCIAAGPTTSGCIDLNGSLWLWGAEGSLGLPIYRPTTPLPKKALLPHAHFLLFQIGGNPSASDVRHKGCYFTIPDWQRTTPHHSIPDLERRMMFQHSTRQIAGEIDFSEGKETPKNPFHQYFSDNEDDDDPQASKNSGKKTHKGFTTTQEKKEVLTVDAMMKLAKRMAVQMERIKGDRLSPTICCELSVGPAHEMVSKASSSGRLIAFPEDQFGNVTVVLPAKGRFNAFSELYMSSKVNIVQCEGRFVYSWGPAGESKLGRRTKTGPPEKKRSPHDWRPAKKEKPVMLAPARLTAFVRSSTAITAIAVGGIHVLALTIHGRVFMWGDQEACLGPQGFMRHNFTEPAPIGGALENVRVLRIGAGLIDSAVQIEAVDTIIGWELLETFEDDKSLNPAIFQYTLSGPRFGPRSGDTRGGRLTLAHSEALQVLLLQDMGGGGGGTGPQALPPGVGRIGKDGEHGRKGPAALAQRAVNQDVREQLHETLSSADMRRKHGNRGATLGRHFSKNAGHALFEWAAKQNYYRDIRRGAATQSLKMDVPRPIAYIAEIDISIAITRRREPVSLERFMARLRRRHDEVRRREKAALAKSEELLARTKAKVGESEKEKDKEKEPLPPTSLMPR